MPGKTKGRVLFVMHPGLYKLFREALLDVENRRGSANRLIAAMWGGRELWSACKQAWEISLAAIAKVNPDCILQCVEFLSDGTCEASICEETLDDGM